MRKFTEFSTQLMIIVLLGLIAIQVSVILDLYVLALLLGICVALVAIGATMHYQHRLRQ